MASLVEADHYLRPDDLAATVAEHAGRLGMADVVVYLVDVDQRLLVPVDGRGLPPQEPQDVDASIAGRAFRTEQLLEEPAPGGDGVRMVVPLIDGAERLGVLAFTVGQVDDTLRWRARHLASVVAAMAVSKLSYGDKLVLVRRLREMDLAAELRWSLLPPLTFSSPRVGISGILEPAYEIAGDCFDYAVNGDLVHLAIVDAMGHGLEASRMATLAITSYRHSRRRGLGLLDTFTAMDELVASQFGMEKFVTGQLGLLDLPTGRLAWLNAGHPKPMLLRDGMVSDLGECETALPIGLGDIPRAAAEVSLRPGDAVLFLTDGVIEARSPDGHQFGRTRLSRLWVEAAAAGDVPAEVMRRLCHAVLDHQRGQLQDDATLMVVVWKGPGTPPEG
jgi:hypothetical protein